MAGELFIDATDALNVYSIILSSNKGYAYNTSSHAIELFNAANWGVYAISLNELASSGGLYVGNFPTLITANNEYTVVYYSRVGGSPATTDTKLGTQLIEWVNGAQFTLANLAVSLPVISIGGYVSDPSPTILEFLITVPSALPGTDLTGRFMVFTQSTTVTLGLGYQITSYDILTGLASVADLNAAPQTDDQFALAGAVGS